MGFFGSDTSPITVLDLGSHQIRVLIAQRREDSKLEMLGYGQRKSLGVCEGLIVNPRLAEQSLADAVASAENLASTNVSRAYVGLCNKMVRSVTITLEQDLGGQVITPALRASLRQTAEEQATARLPQSANGQMQWAHLHLIPLGYSIDGSEVTDAPDGLYGATLRAQFHIVSVPMTAVQNLRQCLARNGIEVERFILSPYAAALSVLEAGQRQYGATLVDMGGGTTSLALFGGWKLLQTAVLPFGAGDVTRDVAQHFGFEEDRAEKLKVKEGNLAAALSPTTIDAAAPLFQAQGFEHSELNPIIEARMREILLAVQETLAMPSFARHASHTLVFSGAGSQLKGLLAYAESLFHDKRVRLATPSPLPGAPEALRHPSFATADGLLRYAAKLRAQSPASQGLLARAPLSPQKLPMLRRLFGN